MVARSSAEAKFRALAHGPTFDTVSDLLLSMVVFFFNPRGGDLRLQ